MNVYEVTVSRSVFTEKWLFTANSLIVAVEKANKKLKRSPRLYEGYEVARASVVNGDFIN